MEARIEAAADEADTEPLSGHVIRRKRSRLRSIRSQAELAAVEFGVADAKFLQSFGRTAVPVGREDISHVAEFLHADLARPEACRGEIAKAVEEADAISHRCRRFPRPGNVVEDRLALRLAGVGECFCKSRFGLSVDPGESAAHPLLAARTIRHREIHEF